MKTSIVAEFGKVKKTCADISLKKMNDYGPAWRVLRPKSLTDQSFIKVQRIRSIREKKVNKVGESEEDGLRAIFNYAVIGLIQLEIDGSSLTNEEDITLR